MDPFRKLIRLPPLGPEIALDSEPKSQDAVLRIVERLGKVLGIWHDRWELPGMKSYFIGGEYWLVPCKTLAICAWEPAYSLNPLKDFDPYNFLEVKQIRVGLDGENFCRDFESSDGEIAFYYYSFTMEDPEWEDGPWWDYLDKLVPIIEKHNAELRPEYERSLIVEKTHNIEMKARKISGWKP